MVKTIANEERDPISHSEGNSQRDVNSNVKHLAFKIKWETVGLIEEQENEEYNYIMQTDFKEIYNFGIGFIINRIFIYLYII